LRKARPVTRQLPEETETYDAFMVLHRTSATGSSGVTVEISTGYGGEPHWWVVPTGPVGQGEFRFLSGSAHVPPLVTMRAVGGGPAVDLHPRYVTADAAVPGPAQAYRDGAVLRHRYVLAE